MKTPIAPRLVSFQAQFCAFVTATLLLLAVSPSSQADPLPGTTPLVPGQTVIPTLIPNGTPIGTVFGATTITSSGFNFTQAVFLNSTGTLDFYFQLTNTSPAGTFFSRFQESGFAAYATSVGFRLDGGSITLPVGSFVNGTVPATTADRSANGNDVGFNFSALTSGTSSLVFVFSTNAAAFAQVNSSGRLDFTGTITGFSTFTTFVPTGPAVPPTAGVPESGATALLLSLGVAGLFFAQAVSRRRQPEVTAHVACSRGRSCSRGR